LWSFGAGAVFGCNVVGWFCTFDEFFLEESSDHFVHGSAAELSPACEFGNALGAVGEEAEDGVGGFVALVQ